MYGMSHTLQSYYSAATPTYSYPNEMEAENDYKEKRLKYLQQIAGKTEVATPDDYENEELYVKMAHHYYVCKLFSGNLKF